jgi:hypothetical protein
MGRKLFVVMRHGGQWGIRASDAPFLSCDSYQEALDVATEAAAILRSANATWGDCSSRGTPPARLPAVASPNTRGKY